jgi:hypothetical protein
MNAIGYRLNIGYNHSTHSDLKSEKTMITDQDLNELRAEAIRTGMKADNARLAADIAREDAARAKEDAARAKEDAARAKEDAARAKEDAEKSMALSKIELDRADAHMREALAEMGRRLGSMGQNQGDVAEEFFYNSLEDSPTLGGIHYDFKDKSWRKRWGKVQDEFDIVLVNAEHVALIEVKYKAHANDLATLLDKKISNFKILFPEYANYQHHLGFASLHMNDELKQNALDAGVMVLQRKGDVMESFLPTL